MRPAPTLLCLALMGCIGLPAAAQVVTLQVTDTSAPGSPIHISGSVIVAESIETSARCAVVHASRCSIGSTQKEIKMRNVGNRPIVGYVASLRIRTPNGNFKGGNYESERIFSRLFVPGETESWPPENGGTEIRSQSADLKPTTSEASAQVVFVQFGDGTIFGDVKSGENLLRTRQQALESLAQLDAIYTEQGEQAFIQAAQQPGAGGMLGIAQFEEQDGPAATIARIRRMLATAKERLAAMSAQPSRQLRFFQLVLPGSTKFKG
jgi:hypothetical protein